MRKTHPLCSDIANAYTAEKYVLTHYTKHEFDKIECTRKIPQEILGYRNEQTHDELKTFSAALPQVSLPPAPT